MPDGGQRLGVRISGWIFDLAEKLGLLDWTDKEKQRRIDWIAADSYEDLAAFVQKYDDQTAGALRAKGRMVGLTEAQIDSLVSEADPAIKDNPSAFLARQLQAAAATPEWQEFNEVMGALAIDPWLSTLVGGRLDPNAPELDAVRRFLGTVAAFETLGAIVSSTVETLSAGQIDNAGRFLTDLKWSLGICFTSWQSTSPVVEAVVLKPLQRLINQTFRESDFTRAQWMDLYALGKISPQRLGVELARQGYSTEKIGWLVELARRQPSRGDLLSMWRKDIIGPVEFADGLRKLGYAPSWIDRYVRLYQADEAKDEKGAYIGTLRKAFKEQLIGETEVREALRAQGRSDEAIDLEIAVLKLSWEVEEKTAAKSDVRAAYMADVIGAPEARNALAQAGFSAHTVDLLLSTWERQRAPAYRQINKSEALKAWGVGVLSRPECYQLLLRVGYDERGATVLMETYARSHLATKPPEVRELSPSDIMLAWHTEVITDDEARAKLVGIGLSEEDAILKLETFRRLHPRIPQAITKELHRDDILEAWGRGVIDVGETAERLAAIDYAPEDVTLLMNSYALRPEALPQEPTVSELIAATRRGVITPAALSQKLIAKGISEEDTAFYVTYATTPLPERTRSLSRKDILDLWTQGRHPRAWALERLLALNYSPEDAEDILWLASPAIEDTETYVLWQVGVIDDQVAAAMWSSMGFTQEQISEVLAGG